MRLSEIKGEAALDLLADIIEPMTEIMSDPKVKELFEKKDKAAVIKCIIKNHKSAIIEILATVDGVPVKDYDMNVFTLPIKLLELFNDPELINFFTSQGLMEDQTSSIAPMVNTKAKEK